MRSRTDVEVTATPEAAVHPRTTLRGLPDVVAACVALPAGIYLTVHAAGGLATFCAGLFSLALVVLLVTSSVYHTVAWPPRRHALLSRLDHAAIFALIGASAAPFCLCTDLPLGPHVLGVGWSCAAFGALHSLLGAAADRSVRAALFVLLGLGLVPSLPALHRLLPGPAFALAVAGGASYVAGAWVYVRRWPNPSPRHFGYHEVFHLFVFAGAASHYGAIWRIVT
jgi:hemolysin III